MIKHDLRVGETIEIGGTKVTLQRKSGQIASLVIDAPDDVVIKRQLKPHETQEDSAGHAPNLVV
ncbi:CsrA-like regulator [Erwinia phage Pavtok]|uniref:Putative Csr like transcritptional regulator n=1 Tax=Erwinia phage Pavtok TaxID=2267655 RepID=A0A345BLW6_9CAUD|nr:CsrA-like regulator [Erwinia phage Pavtok]AXF51437.1 putative Csr like transcritptional regulator [Erwinia phage Pavtok]